MRLCLLASGSKGNAAIIDDGETRILVDAGLSAREICRRLDSVGIDPATLDALLVTHEHTDHARFQLRARHVRAVLAGSGPWFGVWVCRFTSIPT